jgi:multidrug efflux pump subunit AcrB
MNGIPILIVAVVVAIVFMMKRAGQISSKDARAYLKNGALGAFFTATSMIGFMAGAGIVVRNSIILVDFIEQRLREGLPLAEAVVEAGMVRFRPILLTALAVVVGASVMLSDPIFQGLAISLMSGSLVSMIIAPVAVPLLYFMANNRKPGVAACPKSES